MREYPFDLTSAKRGEVFPSELQLDQWILFHGTSGCHAESIESQGLRPGSCELSVELLGSICRLSERIRYVGRAGGIPVLRGFTEFDHRMGLPKPVFLSEVPRRCGLYASPDFDGGESLRALRIAIADLQGYAESESLRARCERDRWLTFLKSISIATDLGIESLDSVSLEEAESALSNAYPRADLSRLRQLMPEQTDYDTIRREITGLVQRANEVLDSLTPSSFGCIYAIRLDTGDLPHLAYRDGSGIESYMDLLPERLVAYVRVPYTAPPRWYDGSPSEFDLIVHKRSGGVVNALRNQERQRVGKN